MLLQIYLNLLLFVFYFFQCVYLAFFLYVALSLLFKSFPFCVSLIFHSLQMFRSSVSFLLIILFLLQSFIFFPFIKNHLERFLMILVMFSDFFYFN